MLSALTALVAEYRTPATNALTADWIFSSNFTPNPSNGGVKGGFAHLGYCEGDESSTRKIGLPILCAVISKASLTWTLFF